MEHDRSNYRDKRDSYFVIGNAAQWAIVVMLLLGLIFGWNWAD